MSSITTQQTRHERANSTSSTTSNSSYTSSHSTIDGWLILNGHSRSSSISSTDTAPIQLTNTYNPFLQLSPVTRGATESEGATAKFVPTENAEERQRLFLLRARDN